MSSFSHITSPPPQLPHINVTMPYSPPVSQPGSRAYSPYAPSPVGSFNSLASPQRGQYALPPMTGGYSAPSYAAPTSSSASRLAPGAGPGGYTSRGYANSPSPGTPQNIMMGMPGAGSGGGLPHQQQQVNRPMSGAGVPVMKGTLRPGQEVKVGDNVVVVEKYLSEGGYAHVYLTHSSRPIGPNGLKIHCLKRIAFDDSQADMMVDTKKEIEVMKTLSGTGSKDGSGTSGSRWIVEYLGSEMNRTEGRNGRGWEVFILMEFCGGGGILDLLNKRLRDRLKEREILDIFVDVCEAVAHMHSLPRPLLHRDLKIENILCHPKSPSIASSSSSISDFQFKLCDFGSTTYPADHPPRSKKEADELAYDLNRHTTLQYRSPEMVEPLLGLPVGLPADVWALGVLLYKLCYYTTPFEEHGPLAIVNAKYTFPAFPVYSPLMQHLIASLLMEQPIRRPSVFDVLLKVHEMRGTRANPKYENMPTQAAAPSRFSEPPVTPKPSGPMAATPAEAHASMMASIQPQRRGRPARGAEPAAVAQPPKQIPAVAAALDAMRSTPATLPQQQAGSSSKAFSMQLTGERLPGQPAAPTLSVRGPSTSFDMDFGDAFRPGQQATGPTKPAQPDLLDSIGDSTAAEDLAKAFSPSGDRQNSASSTPDNAGFADSFGPDRSFASARQDASRNNLTAKPSIGRSASSSSSSSPQAVASFEDRFPSIEALTSGEERAATLNMSGMAGRQDTSRRETNESPLLPSSFGSRPQYQGMSSFRASLTGEDASASEPHKASVAVDGRPLPRSNHVTGSAFMSESPSEERPSFIRIGSSAIPVSDDVRARSNNRSNSPPSSRYGAIRLEDSPPPLKRQPSAPARDLLTDDDALQVKAGYLTMMPQANGKSASGRAPPPTSNKPRHLSLGLSSGSSGAPTVQVELPPSSAGIRPQPPVKPQGLLGARQESRAEDQSSSGAIGSRVSQATMDTSKLPVSASEPSVSSNDISTPVTASGSLRNSSPSPIPNHSRQSSYTGAPPPGPVRRGSINDIVSRFERMSSPPITPAEVGPGPVLARSESQKGLGRVAPPVGSKPNGAKPSGGGLDSGSAISIGGTSGETANGTGTPLLKPVARYGRFNVEPPSQPTPATQSHTSTTSDLSEPKLAPTDQKESIKSRIAMWNQAGPPVGGSSGSGSGPPALKPKPTTLGSGRRL